MGNQSDSAGENYLTTKSAKLKLSLTFCNAVTFSKEMNRLNQYEVMFVPMANDMMDTLGVT